MIETGTTARALRAGLYGLLALGLVHPAMARSDDFDVSKWIEEQVSGPETLSIAAARIDGDELETFAYGPIDGDSDRSADSGTRYQVGSLTKPFTNLLLAEMVEAGEVGYDTTVASLIGDEVEFTNPDVGGITLLQLATHTSGLPRLPANLDIRNPAQPYAGYGEDELLAAAGSARNRQRLGDHYAYSNFGTGLLGYLLGRVHGGGYEAALRERVLEPLGLSETGFDPETNRAAGFSGGEIVQDWTFDALAGAGALWSSVDDLVRLARIHLGLIENPLDHAIADDRKIVEPEAGGFALTRVWHVADSPEGRVYWHNGGTGGFGSFFGFRPANGEALILLVSGRADPTSAGLQSMSAAPGKAILPKADRSVTGQYELDDERDIGVFVDEGRIMAQLSGRSPQPVTPVGADWYAHDVFDISLHFVRDDGKVVAVELVQKGRVERFERVGDSARVMRREEVEIDRESLRDYVGEYALAPSIRFTVRVGEERLEAKLSGQPFLQLFAEGGDVFFYKAVDAELHFERDENGNVSALVLHQGGIRQRATRVE